MTLLPSLRHPVDFLKRFWADSGAIRATPLSLLLLSCAGDPCETFYRSEFVRSRAEAPINAKDFFDWYDELQSLPADIDISSASKQGLDCKIAFLRKNAPPRPFNNQIELVAYQWQLRETVNEREGRYRSYWLLHALEDIPVTTLANLRLILSFSAHESFMPGIVRDEDRDNYNHTGTYRLALEQGAWTKDSYHLMTAPCRKWLAPYKLETYFIFKPEGGGIEKWGDRIDLGLHIDLP